MTQVLVVDDEPMVAEVVDRYLRRDGYDVVVVGDGEAALEAVARERPGLVILDLMLPKIDGLGGCRRLRGRSQVPIIMLTAKGEELDRIVGLELGADDYLTKPFSPRELVARVKTVLRRAQADSQERSDVLDFGDVVIDASRRTVRVNELPVELTAKEFDLLHFLAK